MFAQKQAQLLFFLRTKQAQLLAGPLCCSLFRQPMGSTRQIWEKNERWDLFFSKKKAKFRPGSSAGPEDLSQRSMKVTNTVHQRHSQRTYTHPYKYAHVNPTPRSIFEDCAGKSSKLTKSPQASRCRQEHRLPLKAQTPLNPEKFTFIRSRIQNLRYY
jgi:hypothetical protein